MKPVAGKRNQLIECTSQPKRNDLWILRWFWMILAWIPTCPRGLTTSPEWCTRFWKAGAGAVPCSLGPGAEERSGPMGSQNMPGVSERWEGHQSPLMGRQVWQGRADWEGQGLCLKGRLERREGANQATNAG